MEPAALAREIKSLAAASGFDDCRVARANRASHADVFLAWLRDGCHGEMAWMEREPERRADPRIVLPGCQSVLVLAVNYFPGVSPPAPLDGRAPGRIARYAWNDDYHDLILPRLRALDARLVELGGIQKCYVDTGPVLERDHASAAGLGWNGKSTVQIHRQLGTWFFLAAILTTLEALPDEASRDHCGKCTRCIDACPTGAITAPHRVDARRCVSYLTIEHKGPIPEHLRPLLGDRIYGCDDCLAACPWNRFAQRSSEARYHAREEIFALGLRDYLALDDEAFRLLFRRSPIKRIKRPRFLRNVCVALGNVGGLDDLPALASAALDPDPLISEHARWAIGEIQKRKSCASS